MTDSQRRQIKGALLQCAKILWEYEEKSDENFVAKYIKFPKDEIFYFAREFIKAAASAEKAEDDFFKMGRFFSKVDK